MRNVLVSLAVWARWGLGVHVGSSLPGGRGGGAGLIWFPFSGGHRTLLQLCLRHKGSPHPLPGPPGPALCLEVRATLLASRPFAELRESGRFTTCGSPREGFRDHRRAGGCWRGFPSRGGVSSLRCSVSDLLPAHLTISLSGPGSKPQLLPASDFTPLSLSFHTWILGIIIVPLIGWFSGFNEILCKKLKIVSGT